jgi:hypothetical protein
MGEFFFSQILDDGMGSIVSPQNSCVEILTASTSEWDCIWS